MVKVYSKNNCMQCKMTKKWLSEHAIAFEEHNIDVEPEYRQVVLDMGYMAVPVVETANGKHFQGFAPDKLKALASA
ncbi:MAG: glutaredoxin-like protein NrdH [Streptococcaceae bacterium]|nr:glutaredoxin-like protein NrdH [Streptococcaceae bacterium]